MTKTIHHTIVKSAARHDARFAETEDGGFFLVKISDERYSSLPDSWDTVGEAMEALKEGAIEWNLPKGMTASNHCGVMVASYHARYSSNSHGPGCNDTLDCSMRDLMTVPNPNGDKRNKTVLDLDAIRATADANGLWNEKWNPLNPGMQRMNLANRLRGWLRNHDGEVVLVAYDGTRHTGRFGVELNEKVSRKVAAIVAATGPQEVARAAKRELKKAA